MESLKDRKPVPRSAGNGVLSGTGTQETSRVRSRRCQHQVSKTGGLGCRRAAQCTPCRACAGQTIEILPGGQVPELGRGKVAFPTSPHWIGRSDSVQFHRQESQILLGRTRPVARR